MLLIAAANDVDPRAVEILRRLDGVEVTQNSPQTVVITENEAFPARLEVVDADEIPARMRAGGDDELVLVVNAVLDDESAARLEDANASYIDVTGRRWMRSWARTKRTREATARGRRRLYPASVRLAQLLADHPYEPWTERGLAGRGMTTQTTAHRLLGRLEEEGLLQREGRGPTTLRWVRDPPVLRRWLAREARPRRVARLACFVEDPARLPELAGRSLALTGAAGAEQIGIRVMTQGVIPTMRVSVRPEELEDVPEALGGFRTETGANLILIADPERLAFVDGVSARDGRLLAPPSRIMLDLFLEARGEAAVDVFLSLWGGREVWA